MGERVLWAFRHDLPGESDEQLTDRARNGDQTAFGELYRRHRKAAESTAWCLLRSKSDADDVVSDAFAGVLSALRNGRGPRDNFRGYLLACVRNGCRSRRTPTVLVDEDQLDRWNPAVEDPERYVEADTVARAFSTLAPRWQQTLWMTEVEQLHPSEVSERLELTPNAAAALTHRARQAFAEAYLAEHLVAATDKDCRKIAPLLPGYVRNQLRDLQQASVERHVVNCQFCPHAVGDLRDVNASLGSLLPLGPAAIGGAAAATQAVVAGTAATVGGLSVGLPSGGLLLKGLIAVVLVAPVLSTDSPFSGRGVDDQRAVAVAESETVESAAGNAAPQAGTRPATAAAPAVTTASPAPVTTVPEAGAGSGVGQRPTASVAPTEPPASPTTVPVTLPVTIPVTAPSGLLPNVPVVGGLVDDLLENTVEPVVGAVTEPVVETIDGALALMGLGSTGETVIMLRSLVPLLDGPLLGSVVDELLDVTSIGTGSPTSPTGTGADAPDAGDPVAAAPGDAVPGDETPGGSGNPGNPGIPAIPGVPGLPGVEPPLPGTPGAPSITVPAVSVPVISLPPISIPAISLPPISVPILDLPPITLPVISLPLISLPPITIPDLLG